jgi:hypothetical protein
MTCCATEERQDVRIGRRLSHQALIRIWPEVADTVIKAHMQAAFELLYRELSKTKGVLAPSSAAQPPNTPENTLGHPSVARP